jgi:hypothetical protein
MLDVVVSGPVARAPDTVAAFLFEPANDPLWIGGLVEVHPPGMPLAPGVRVARVARFMRRRIDYVLEVERVEPGRLLAMRSVRAPFPMAVTYEIEPAGAAASTVTLRVQGGPGGPMRLLHPLMAHQVRRNLEADLHRLRACLEID